MKSLLLFTVAGAALCATAAVSLATPNNTTPATPTKTEAYATGSISGKVMWEGDRPEAKPPLVFGEKESKGCHHGDEEMDSTDHTLLIDKNGGVANVVVTVEVEGAEVMVPKEPITIDQHGCRFKPHVVVVPVGATLRFDNSDETNHNIHTFAKKNQPVNKNVAGGTSFDQVLDKAEVIEVKCDVHPWMKGYVYVSDSAHYAVTEPDGSFTIEGLPPGEYKVSYWHEEIGKGKSDAITVADGPAEAMIQVGDSQKKAGGRRRR